MVNERATQKEENKGRKERKERRLGKNQEVFLEAWKNGIQDVKGIVEYSIQVGHELNERQCTSCMGSLWKRGLLNMINTESAHYQVGTISISVEECMEAGVQEEMDYLQKHGVYETLEEIVGKEVPYRDIEVDEEGSLEDTDKITEIVLRDSVKSVLERGFLKVLNDKYGVEYNSTWDSFHSFIDKDERRYDYIRDLNCVKVKIEGKWGLRARVYNEVIGCLHSNFAWGYTLEDYERDQEKKMEFRKQEAKRREEEEERRREEQEQRRRAHERWENNGEEAHSYMNKWHREILAGRVLYDLTGDDKKDYRALSSLVHPDKWSADDEKNGGLSLYDRQEMMKELNVLYFK